VSADQLFSDSIATEDAEDAVFALHRGGKIAMTTSVPLRDRDDLSLAYTPGVAKVCEAIAERPALVRDYTWVSNTVAIVTDGTAVLGLGDIGPRAAMPVMEGKAVLFKEFGGVDAMPICLDCTDVDELVDTVTRLAPSFGGINLEDISAPRCFEVERRLQERLDIPVFHDDQHGTSIVVLAALRGAMALTGRGLETSRIVISGAGAAGVAVTRTLQLAGAADIVVADSRGVLSPSRTGLTAVKAELAATTNPRRVSGGLESALDAADVFIGVSGG
jgi:malate dehydrogenase (oxaloacetate-decarboxylating)